MKIVNAFSLNMLPTLDAVVKFKQVSRPATWEGHESYIGHADTANILGLPTNRVSVSMAVGETILICQYCGPRLPEGSMTLPVGAVINFIEATCM